MGATLQGRGEEALAAQDNPILWMSAITAVFKLAPSKQIRNSTGVYSTRHRFRSITIVFCYTLHGSYGKPITPKERPRVENVVDLMDALRKTAGGAAAGSKPPKSAKKPRKAAAGQKEMLIPIAGEKPAKEAAAKKPAVKPQRKSA